MRTLFGPLYIDEGFVVVKPSIRADYCRMITAWEYAQTALPSLRRPASVHRQRLPRHEGSRLGAKVKSGGAHFLDVSPAPDGQLADETGVDLRVVDERDV